MMDITPRYVTVDDFDAYHNVNLREMLRSGANESNAANAFLFRVENLLMARIDSQTFRRFRYEELKGKQLEAFQMAILEQAMYTFRNGDLGMDSGYDAEKGMIASKADIEGIIVCDNAITILSNAGLWNLVMKNRPRKFGGGFIPGNF